MTEIATALTNAANGTECIENAETKVKKPWIKMKDEPNGLRIDSKVKIKQNDKWIKGTVINTALGWGGLMVNVAFEEDVIDPSTGHLTDRLGYTAIGGELHTSEYNIFDREEANRAREMRIRKYK